MLQVAVEIVYPDFSCGILERHLGENIFTLEFKLLGLYFELLGLYFPEEVDRTDVAMVEMLWYENFLVQGLLGFKLYGELVFLLMIGFLPFPNFISDMFTR